MTSSKQPVILLKDISNNEFDQISNNIHIEEENLIEDINISSHRKEDISSINKIPFNSPDSNIEESALDDSVNFQIKKKDKPARMKIKFPLMGKMKLNNKNNVDEKRSESKDENCKVANLEEISSSQEKSTDNEINGKKSRKRSKSQKRSHVGRPGLSFSELEKETYLKPLKNGWKREVVYRNTFTGNVRSSDIYYYTPTGKKLRSRVEIGRFLNENGITDFTLEHFSFSKFLVGAGEPYEIHRNANTPKGNSPKKSQSAAVTKFVSKPQPKSKPVSLSTKSTIFKNILDKGIPICNGNLSEESSKVRLAEPRTSFNKRKRTSLHLENKSKFIKLRDRQSIHPPARFEVMAENDDDDDDDEITGPSTNLPTYVRQEDRNRPTYVRQEDRNRPEELVVEPDLYFDNDLDDENVRLNFPFGIDESDDQTTAAIPDSILKRSLLSDENLPPIVEKDCSKPDFPLIQLNFEDLYVGDEGGGGGTDELHENRELPVPKNPSKIRVRPLDELCDTTPRLDTQPSSINPVIMNFNINANVQSYFPNCNGGLPSIPTIPIPHHLSYNNGGSVPVFVNMPNYTQNNSVVSDSRILRLPFRIPNTNIEKSVPFQNGVPNFVKVAKPINSNITPNLDDGNTYFNNYNETLITTPSGNLMRSRNFNHRQLLPRSTCTIQGKSYEFVMGPNNTPVLRQVSQNSTKKL